MMKNLLILSAWLLSGYVLLAQGQSTLRFNENGTFKILQFTDVHWDNASSECTKTLETINNVLQTEQPDFVIFTGDVVTTDPLVEGWDRLSAPVIAAKIPWSITFGNHDEEQNLSKEAIFEYLQLLPYFIGQKGEVSGVGNFTLTVKDSKTGLKDKAVMYLIDSHSYTHNPKLGSYDWIKFDQIDWYRKQSETFTQKNGGVPLPSVAFFHIPLLEYNEIAEDKQTLGYKGEGIASSKVNSGLFASFIENKDVMGVFVGHDHENNYIGINKGIALGYGQATGYDAYGDLERGGRVIVLEEGNFAFHTWISTPTTHKYDFYYPAGLSVITDSTQVVNAAEVNPHLQGVNYRYYEYEGKINSVDTLSFLNAKQEGILPNISIKSAKKQDYFAFEYEAWLKVPDTGFYKFYTYSDDGSKLYVDGQLVVDNDGGHSAKREEGKIALKKGFHKLKVQYFESYMGNALEVGWSSIKMLEAPIQPKYLYRLE